MSNNFSRNEVKKYLITSSKEMSRLIEYISFGILIANFSKYELINKPLLFISCFLSSLVLIMHFYQYKKMYVLSLKALEEQTVSKRLIVPYSSTRCLFQIKEYLLYISIFLFIFVGWNILNPEGFHRMTKCIFS